LDSSYLLDGMAGYMSPWI